MAALPWARGTDGYAGDIVVGLNEAVLALCSFCKGTGGQVIGTYSRVASVCIIHTNITRLSVRQRGHRTQYRTTSVMTLTVVYAQCAVSKVERHRVFFRHCRFIIKTWNVDTRQDTFWKQLSIVTTPREFSTGSWMRMLRSIERETKGPKSNIKMSTLHKIAPA